MAEAMVRRKINVPLARDTECVATDAISTIRGAWNSGPMPQASRSCTTTIKAQFRWAGRRIAIPLPSASSPALVQSTPLYRPSLRMSRAAKTVIALMGTAAISNQVPDKTGVASGTIWK
jgi:hypothetical protein